MDVIFNKLSSLRTYLSVVLAFFILLFGGSILYYQQSQQDVQTFYSKELSANLNEVKSQTLDTLLRYRREIEFLSATPPVEGLYRAELNGGIDPLDNTTYDQWVARLNTIFEAYMMNMVHIYQLRIIRANGEEIVRVERANGVVSASKKFQNKQTTNYVKEGLQLAPSDVYISPIELNREFGKIQFPHTPVIRLVKAVYSDDEAIWGLIVINVDANYLLSEVSDLVSAPEHVMLLDYSLNFITHPDERLAFSKDLLPEATWSRRYNILSKQADLMTFEDNQTSETFIGIMKNVRFGADNNAHISALTYIASSELDDLAIHRTYIFNGIIFFISLISLAVFTFYSRLSSKSAALAESRQFADNIVTNSFDAFINIDQNNQIISVNSAAEKLFEIPSEEVVGKRLSSLPAFYNVDLDSVKQKLSLINSPHTTVEVEFGAKDVKRTLLVSFTILKSDPSVTYAVISKDITAQKNYEAQMRLDNEFLEEKVAERTTELERAKKDAENVSKIKSNFISNVSHDMRTPLNGIVGGLKLIRVEQLSERGNHYLDLVESSTETLGVLINDILDLSKIEAGKLELIPTSFNPESLLETLCKSMAIKAYEKGLEFLVDTSEIRFSKITVDKKRLIQITNNIINNAIKFTQKGTISLKAWTEAHGGSSGKLYVTIKDTGRHIGKKLNKNF